MFSVCVLSLVCGGVVSVCDDGDPLLIRWSDPFFIRSSSLVLLPTLIVDRRSLIANRGSSIANRGSSIANRGCLIVSWMFDRIVDV